MNSIELNRTVKAQAIRVADVFVIGPLMVAGGLAMADAKKPKPLLGLTLAFFGVATVVFNGVNWAIIRNQRALELEAEAASASSPGA